MNAEGDEVDALERDVDRIRNNIGELIRELNYRRHEAFDLKLQFQRHAARVILAGAAMFAVVAGAIVLAVARQRRRRIHWRPRDPAAESAAAHLRPPRTARGTAAQRVAQGGGRRRQRHRFGAG